jgi:hypothetical protein
MVFLLGCGGLGPNLKKEPSPKGQDARLVVGRSPCSLLHAIRDALGRDPTDARKSRTWAISFDTDGCCNEKSKVELRSAIVTFAGPDPDAPSLIDWNDKCEDGFGGPVRVTNGEVAFHYVYLFDKGPSDLAFNITPSVVEFERGKKKNAVIQGCPDIQGVARLVSSTN